MDSENEYAAGLRVVVLVFQVLPLGNGWVLSLFKESFLQVRVEDTLPTEVDPSIDSYLCTIRISTGNPPGRHHS
jgi:hypothetical protein